MKEADLRKFTTCACCNRKVLADAHLPIFWTLRIRRHGLNMDAVRRQDALGAFMGSPVLAHVLGADEELSQTLADVEVAVCEACALAPKLDASLLVLATT